MTPIQSIPYGEEFTDEQRTALFYEWRGQSCFKAVLQYLRDEAFASLDKSIKDKVSGKLAESDMAFGAFDGLSQVVAKLNAASEIAPAPPQ